MDTKKTHDLVYSEYCGEKDLPAISKMVAERLSEPYSDFTYRYFFNNWPRLSFLVHDRARDNKLIGCVISKIDINSREQRQGYIGMLAVDPEYRGQNIGSTLVRLSMRAMMEHDVEFIQLETERCNVAALNLYQKLGFSRTKLFKRYYMNGSDAYRMKFWIKLPYSPEIEHQTTDQENEGDAERNN